MNEFTFDIDRFIKERSLLCCFKGGGGKKVELSPLADPIPTPEEIDLQALEKGEAERRRIRARKGRAGTILTESTLGTTAIAKSPILGVVGGA